MSFKINMHSWILYVFLKQAWCRTGACMAIGRCWRRSERMKIWCSGVKACL